MNNILYDDTGNNNQPDYQNNLAFDPDINTMPRCDIEALKSEKECLKELLKECNNELKILRMLSLPMASKEVLSECEAILTKIDNAIGGGKN